MTWRERIVAARERGAFTGADVDDARDWCTCAVGEQHAAMPLVVAFGRGCPCGTLDCTEHSDAPLDDGLFFPGRDFYYAVKRDNFAGADSLLDAIEDRVLQLKRESA